MEKKVMLITGASGGIGREIAHYFNNGKFHLLLHHNESKLAIPESEYVTHLKADLSQYVGVQDLIANALIPFNKVDIVINNSGISLSAMSWKTTVDDWNRTIAVNLTAPFLLSQGFIPAMRKLNYGVIINITSVVAQTGMPGTAAYAASKSGLIGLTKTLARELAPNNIRVNALALGYFNQGMINDVPQNIQEEIIESIPAKKLGDPLTICKTLEWLIDDASAYVNGQVINLNGGLYS